MKYCQECGRMLRDSDDSCPYCGTYQDIIKTGSFSGLAPENNAFLDSYDPFSAGNSSEQSGAAGAAGGVYTKEEPVFMGPTGAVMDGGEPIKRYSFWPIFFLSLITFGIYGLYKNYKWTKDVNRLCQGIDKPSLNYILVCLLSIVTFGIYGFYWTYKQTERIRETGYRNGITVEDSGVQNLLLSILCSGFGALAVWYIQYDNTNRLASVFNGTGDRTQVNSKTSHRGAIIAAIILTIATYIFALVISIISAMLAITSDSQISSDLEEWITEEDGGFSDESGSDGFSEDNSFNAPYMRDDYESQGPKADFGNSSISIDGSENVYDYAGNKAIVVTFTWTNKGDESLSALWVYDIMAYQGDSSLIQTWPATNDNTISVDEYMENIEPGEYTTFQVMFEVVDDKEPVLVQVTEFMGDSNYMAEQLINIADETA